MIGRLGRALLGLVRGRVPASLSERSHEDRNGVPAERLEAARRRLKETIPPPQED